MTPEVPTSFDLYSWGSQTGSGKGHHPGDRSWGGPWVTDRSSPSDGEFLVRRLRVSRGLSFLLAGSWVPVLLAGNGLDGPSNEFSAK